MALASLQGRIFVTGESEMSKLHFVAYIELHIDYMQHMVDSPARCCSMRILMPRNRFHGYSDFIHIRDKYILYRHFIM